jgi:quercetin dioxygenase-like cupin family protein
MIFKVLPVLGFGHAQR